MARVIVERRPLEREDIEKRVMDGKSMWIKECTGQRRRWLVVMYNSLGVYIASDSPDVPYKHLDWIDLARSYCWIEKDGYFACCRNIEEE